MLQGLSQLRIALLNLLEQPHILDRDHGLGGKCLQELDLLIREGTYLLSPNQNRSYGNSLAEQRRCERGPMAKALRVVPAFRKFGFRLCREVVDMDGLPVNHGSPGYPI